MNDNEIDASVEKSMAEDVDKAGENLQEMADKAVKPSRMSDAEWHMDCPDFCLSDDKKLGIALRDTAQRALWYREYQTDYAGASEISKINGVAAMAKLGSLIVDNLAAAGITAEYLERDE